MSRRARGSMPSEDPATPSDHLAVHRKTMDVTEDELLGLLAGKDDAAATNVSASGAPEPQSGSAGSESALGVGTVALLVFFTVSGGPMGSEDAVGAVGPLIAILAYLVFPWV